MEFDPASSDDRNGQAFDTADHALRRSAEVLRAMDETLGVRRRVLEAADKSLARADQLLANPDIDLTTRDERPAPTRTVHEWARVLVVDDNPTIRDVVQLLVQLECGDEVTVRCVAGGAEAVASVAWAPDVAVVDRVMPEMDGLETCRRLRAELPDTRILLYSSHLAAEGESEATAAGADRYIEKGADTATLIDEIRTAIARIALRVRP